MKKSPLTAVLLGVLTILSLWSLFLCYTFVTKTRELRRLQNQAAFINYRQQAIAALANDAVEYSKRNSAIDPLLESAGIKQSKSAAAPTKPAAK